MVSATITTSILSGTITTLQIANAFRDALITAGFTTYDSYLTGSTEIRIMSLSMSAATKGTLYLRFDTNSSGNVNNYQIYDSWNTTTKTGTNSGGSINFSVFVGITTITIRSFSHPEFKGIAFEQGTLYGIMGILRPKGSPPSWWDENAYPYGFAAQYNGFPGNSRFVSSINPFGGAAAHEYLQNTKLQDGNPQNSDSRSNIPLTILSIGVAGILQSCDDVIITCSNTMRIMDTVTVSPSEVYTYIWGPATNCGIAIRTT
ncbi:hypothetical protein JYQ62_22145 [Nostoc sp. UHCC 0702]|nr:hypothetical protein JYQ62_22145 [Nostoc sp. UHCC 0702]